MFVTHPFPATATEAGTSSGTESSRQPRILRKVEAMFEEASGFMAVLGWLLLTIGGAPESGINLHAET